ncbi:bifunctional glycosyltransferase/CDP-glycerol:glycerophosphate glycerophosphotransferase [Streptacidiphilus carbonis]|uniref:bifunctional glycosyltransferase/CDP-glycerol:glycerophosphate glycerophosphotransferase n=1 Tax=Streptacidiphilus carbonis TaxID=105422 RepID=UPI0005AB1836|nr:CDP-glycerol glycerophosphotransferase family protein [Streptacidiphilus carbonis]
MPRFSIIVPVHNAQRHLRECLESVLSQGRGDVQLIVVDAGSTDHTAAIAGEFTRLDPRVLLLSSLRSGDQDAALRLGADRASGEYLLLLSADDALTPRALEVLDRALAAAGDPQVLVFAHRTDDWQRRPQPARGAVLPAQSDGGSTAGAAARPTLLRLPALRSNRVLRRDFCAPHGPGPLPGADSELVFAYRSLLDAGTVATSSELCLVRRIQRDPRVPSAVRACDPALLDGFEELLTRVQDQPDLARSVLERLVRTVLDELSRPGDASRSETAAFFRAAAESCTRRRGLTAGGLPGLGGLRARGVLTGSRSLFLAGQALDQARKRLLQGRERLHRRIEGHLVGAARRIGGMLPIRRDLALYCSYWGDSTGSNPGAVQAKARELAPGVRGVWVLTPKGAESAPAGTDHVLLRSPRFWWYATRAGYLVTNSGLGMALPKRPGQRFLMTHHGTPLKKMGLDQLDHPACSAKVNWNRLMGMVAQWDLSLSSNRHSSEVWDRVFPGAFENLEAGYPRNDVLATATGADVLRIREGLGIAPGTTAILYAPTHRDHQREFRLQLDLARLCRALGDDCTLLVRAHYFYGEDAGLRDLQRRGLVRDVSQHPSVEELMLASDALVTDYSSILFDYANLDRPIIVHAPDWEVYRETRGVYFDLLSGRPGETPGLVAADEDTLAHAFRSGAWESEHSAKLRAAFRERFCALDDGRAAERVVRRLFLDQRELPAPLPLAQRPHAPSPRQAQLQVSAPVR